MMLRIERIYGSVNIRVTLAGGSGIILWSGFYIFAQVRVYGKTKPDLSIDKLNYQSGSKNLIVSEVPNRTNMSNEHPDDTC